MTGIETGPLVEASLCYRQGDFARGLQLVNEVIAAQPNLGVAFYLRGIILKDASEPHAAIEAFDRALALDASLDHACYHRGTARFLADDKTGALADLQRAVRLEPDFLFAVYNLGVVAVSLQRWEDATEAFTRCLDLDPANRREYVDLLVEIGRSSAQEECYSQCHRIKNRLGVLGDRARRLLIDLAATPSRTSDPLLENASLLQTDLRQVYEDMARFLHAVNQEPPEVDLIDMADLLERCLFALSPRLRCIRVERSIDGWLPEVIGDPRALGEALMNVLTNAVEACTPALADDALTATEAAHSDGRAMREPTIRIEMLAVDDVPEIPGVDSVRIEIQDSGPGIDPEVQPQIFNLGFTTKRFGSGLGLTYTERVVRAHGGRIDIGCRPGGGAAITLLLPASPVGAPNLRTLSLRSVLFEDLRPLTRRGF